MKVIKCELCGSNDLKKIDGEYVCQYCKTKYTIEEAKKLMVEGTVKIDTSDKQSNLEKLAKRSFDDELYEEAYNYYNRLLELDSDNWEYVLYKGVCAGHQITLDNYSKIDDLIKGCKNAINIIEESDAEIDKEQTYYIIADKINGIIAAFYNKANNYYLDNWRETDIYIKFWEQLEKCIEAEEYALFILNGINLEENDDEKIKDLYLRVLKNLVLFYVEICKKRLKAYKNVAGTAYQTFATWYQGKSREEFIKKYDENVAKIKSIDSSYVPKIIERKAKGGCYVATCVYGSYDCPEVWMLRRYRDYFLDKNILGKIFIKIYYFVSPKIVKIFGNNNTFKKLFRNVLDKKIIKLKEKGYDSTPYEDKV